jgi:hypothetical protein
MGSKLHGDSNREHCDCRDRETCFLEGFHVLLYRQDERRRLFHFSSVSESPD